jgi:hypothetical protein
MRKILALCLPVVLLAACSSSTPDHESSAPISEKEAAAQTDSCLDNPDLSRSWGDCNVKHTVYLESAALAKCRKNAPHAKGSVVFELRVKGDGHVKNAKVVSGGGNGKLVACLQNVMKQLQFASPPKGKEATITVPYQL